MKKFLITIFAFLCMNYSASALQYMVCLDGLAYFLDQGSNGSITITSAGGCALGPWIVQLRIDDNHENDCDAETAEDLNNNLDIENYIPAEEVFDPETIDVLRDMINNCTNVVWLDPDALSSPVLTYLRNHGARIGYQSTNVGSDNFNIFPNPSTGSITLNSNTKIQNSNIEILNSMGQVVHSINNVNADKSDFSMDISNYKTGMYYLKVQTPNEVVNLSFVKQ